jgi:glutathione S-transferase
MEITALIILTALLQFLWFGSRAGGARGKYNIKAPATSGNEIWERIYRVQQNTMEQLVIFIPAMVIFGMYVSHRWVVIPGVLFILGRQLYAHEYIKDPDSRVPGMALSALSSIALILGGFIGIVLKLF